MVDTICLKYLVPNLISVMIILKLLSVAHAANRLFVMKKASRVATCQGKVREKQNLLQVRELSGNFEKMSGNFGHLTNVREFCHDN